MIMNRRLARAISQVVVAAGTAGAVAVACYVLDRLLDDSKRIAKSDEDQTDSELDRDHDSFALLPLVSDDDSSDECSGYTDDRYTPQYDVCVLSVSVETDSNDDISTASCRLCKAVDDCDKSAFSLVDRDRSVSFSETDSSDSEFDYEDKPPARKNWLYVRL